MRSALPMGTAGDRHVLGGLAAGGGGAAHRAEAGSPVEPPPAGGGQRCGLPVPGQSSCPWRAGVLEGRGFWELKGGGPCPQQRAVSDPLARGPAGPHPDHPPAGRPPSPDPDRPLWKTVDTSMMWTRLRETQTRWATTDGEGRGRRHTETGRVPGWAPRRSPSREKTAQVTTQSGHRVRATGGWARPLPFFFRTEACKQKGQRESQGGGGGGQCFLGPGLGSLAGGLMTPHPTTGALRSEADAGGRGGTVRSPGTLGPALSTGDKGFSSYSPCPPCCGGRHAPRRLSGRTLSPGLTQLEPPREVTCLGPPGGALVVNATQF